MRLALLSLILCCSMSSAQQEFKKFLVEKVSWCSQIDKQRLGKAKSWEEKNANSQYGHPLLVMFLTNDSLETEKHCADIEIGLSAVAVHVLGSANRSFCVEQGRQPNTVPLIFHLPCVVRLLQRKRQHPGKPHHILLFESCTCGPSKLGSPNSHRCN